MQVLVTYLDIAKYWHISTYAVQDKCLDHKLVPVAIEYTGNHLFVLEDVRKVFGDERK